MTDISAAMGIEGLKQIDKTLSHYRKVFNAYKVGLEGVPGIKFIGEKDGRFSSCWLATTLVDRRDDLKKKLGEYNVESDPVHYRCDRYSVFGGRVYNCPNMDLLENRYLVLPMHYHMTKEDVNYVCGVIKGGW